MKLAVAVTSSSSRNLCEAGCSSFVNLAVTATAIAVITFVKLAVAVTAVAVLTFVKLAVAVTSRSSNNFCEAGSNKQ